MSPGLAPGGPRVVALGGGHGLAASLTAARSYAGAVAAVVTVADDGGSSGRLRQELALPPPGDLRRCLVALAAEPGLWAEALEHRFDAGALDGHALGNLLIAGLARACGDFQRALDEVGRLLGALGPVFPATAAPVRLTAEVEAGGGRRRTVTGQVAVASSAGIRRIAVEPADAVTAPGVAEAIAAADQVVLGPGSLYTSVLAAAVAPAVRRALAASAARKVYVCNLRPQDPETAGYDVAAHVEALLDHGIEPDVVVCDPRTLPLGRPAVAVAEHPVANGTGASHHPGRLGLALAHLAARD